MTLLLLCNYHGATYIYKVLNDTTYKDLIFSLCEKWKSLIEGSFFLTANIPGHTKCLIDSCIDFTNLVELVMILNIQTVDISVSEKSLALVTTETPISSSTSQVSTDMSLKYSKSADTSITSFFKKSKKTYKSAAWVNEIEDVGQPYSGGAVHFRDSLCKYAALKGFHFNYIKNEPSRVTAECAAKKETGCQWRVHASLDNANGHFYIKTLDNTHTCGAIIQIHSSRISSTMISALIQDMLRKNPNTSPTEARIHVNKSYGLDISYDKAWNAVERARDIVYGGHTESFNEVKCYLEKMLEANPSSRLVLDVDSATNRFRRCFVAFAGCIYGFNFCRPMLFLDGTFLSGRFKGALLAATGKDGNNGLFHFAYAIVDSENKENWNWFLQQLVHVVNPNRQLTFVSDRHQGLIDGVQNVFPNAHHLYCLNHLQQNLKDKMRGFSKETKRKFLDRFRLSANSPNLSLFNTVLSEMRQEGGEKIQKFLDDLPPDRYTNIFFKGHRYGEMTSNAAESFNNMIKGARSLPVTQMIDHIRLKFMNKMSNSRNDGLKWKSMFCPEIEKHLKECLEDVQTWDVSIINHQIYEVHSIPSAIVSIGSQTCTCGIWQYKKYPCPHAIAVLKKKLMSFEEQVDRCYKVNVFRETYSKCIIPVPTYWKFAETSSSEVMVLPPLTKKQPGRPKKKRILSRGEFKKPIQCSRCGKKGSHNKATCKEVI